MFSAAGVLIWGVRPLFVGFLDLLTTKLAEMMPLNLNQAWAAGMTFLRWIGDIPGADGRFQAGAAGGIRDRLSTASLRSEYPGRQWRGLR